MLFANLIRRCRYARSPSAADCYPRCECNGNGNAEGRSARRHAGSRRRLKMSLLRNQCKLFARVLTRIDNLLPVDDHESSAVLFAGEKAAHYANCRIGHSKRRQREEHARDWACSRCDGRRTSGCYYRDRPTRNSFKLGPSTYFGRASYRLHWEQCRN
jgi:hypothetical protein